MNNKKVNYVLLRNDLSFQNNCPNLKLPNI